jgi:small conductance mechanosensitive channel
VNNPDLFGVSTAWVLANAWNVLVAIIVLAVGWVLAGLVSKQVSTLIRARLKNDATIAPLVGQVVRYAILFVTIIVVLGQFGVETASILAVLGAAGLAIALALQGTLANIAAGIMLVFLKPFKAGDYINADGIEGWVVEVELFATRMRTYEGVYMFAPNSKLSNAKIVNYSREASRVVETKFTVPRSADIKQVRSEIAQSLRSQYSAPEEQPEVLIDSMDENKVTLIARMPVQSKDWWQARSLLQEQLMETLDRNNNFAPPDATP